MNHKNMDLKKKEHLAIITIDHPPANTWNLATMESFEKIVDDVEKDPNIRVVIITGTGDKYFSAGFDVKDAANADVISPMGRNIWRRIDRFQKPTIAAINGYALGGGLELTIACHFRIMTDDPETKLGLTELNLGIIPGWGGTQRLPRLVGRAKAMEMIFFSQQVGAKEALEIGLVDKIVPSGHVLESAMTLAGRLSERPPIAMRWVLEAFSAGLYEGLEAGLTIEAEGAGKVRTTEDRNEGFEAFLEKRKPKFRGR